MTKKVQDPVAMRTEKDFPPSFRRIRLELAREKGHPMGSASSGYILVAPLDADSRLDAAAWRKHHALCRVIRFRPEEPDDIGHLIRRPNGSWAFHYDIEGTIHDESGFRLEHEHFITGEYIGVEEESGLRTFQVASVEPI